MEHSRGRFCDPRRWRNIIYRIFDMMHDYMRTLLKNRLLLNLFYMNVHSHIHIYMQYIQIKKKNNERKRVDLILTQNDNLRMLMSEAL